MGSNPLQSFVDMNTILWLLFFFSGLLSSALLNFGKMNIAKDLPFWPFLSAQFRGVTYIHRVVQPSILDSVVWFLSRITHSVKFKEFFGDEHKGRMLIINGADPLLEGRRGWLFLKNMDETSLASLLWGASSEAEFSSGCINETQTFLH